MLWLPVRHCPPAIFFPLLLVSLLPVRLLPLLLCFFLFFLLVNPPSDVLDNLEPLEAGFKAATNADAISNCGLRRGVSCREVSFVHDKQYPLLLSGLSFICS